MAKRQAAGLPDVFAKPGNAPARGTPIEELPPAADAPHPVSDPPHEEAAPATAATPAETPPAAPIVEPAAAAADPTPPAASPEPAPSPPPSPVKPAAAAVPPPPAPNHAPPAAASRPPPAATGHAPPATAGRTPPATAGRTPPAAAGRTPDVRHAPSANAPLFGDLTPTIAWAALIVALTAPLWEGTLLWSIGIRTPEIRYAQRTEAALAQQQADFAAMRQKLAATAGQEDAMRAAVATATQRAAVATEQVRTLAMLRLADALRGSRPFESELTILHSAGADSALKPELAQLQPYAAIGVPTLAQLRQDFQELYENMARTAQQSEPSSWRDLISWTGLAGGPQSAPKNDPTLAAAWDGLGKLASADLAGAIDQATRISGGFQAAFGDWIADARARLAADQALRQLDASAKTATTTPAR